MSNTVTFKVVGDRTIHCNGCEGSINLALNQMSEVNDAHADRTTQMIEVRLSEEESDKSSLISKLDYLGYKVEII